MVRLLLQSFAGSDPASLDVSSTVRLRNLQQTFCRLFRKSFPWHRASLVVHGAAHNDFECQPFLSCGEDEEVQVIVVFERNIDDPFFFDLGDRRGSRATALDEVEWEAACSAGDDSAQEGLELWAARRRAAERVASK